ncbi:MAG: M48 family metallopeptidase [Candidatus Symbiothrix sp.]|jgi:predicted Zn-dependent protease|nr:M48 family metallopeptidase [Candidatus Symbiothrix sp.]
MRNIAIQFLAFILVFLGIWLGLSRIHWVDLFKVKEKTSQLEKKLGDFYIDMIHRTNEEITDTTLVNPLLEIKKRICEPNGIDPESIKLHLMRSSEVNAFALPDHHIVVLSDLVLFCQSPEELAGVMAHEIAHIEKNHIMKKLGKEIGFTALATMLNSGSGGTETLKILTSTAYDRKMEAEADETGVDYLQTSEIDLSGMADFMYRLSTEEDDWLKNLTIISTHPDTEARAQKIVDLMSEKTVECRPVLPDSVWKQLREKI